MVTNEAIDLVPDQLDTRLRQVVHQARDTGLVHTERQGDSPRITPDMPVARAGDPVAMAGAMAQAIRAGAAARAADPMEPRDMAVPSTPVLGKAFLS